MRNTESASPDFERVVAVPESVKDAKIAALENDLQGERESRLQERFLWILAIIILVDIIGLPNAGWGSIVVFVFQIVFVLVLARMCAVNGVYTFLQNAMDLATRRQHRTTHSIDPNSPPPSIPG
jgi:hypothetical protein